MNSTVYQSITRKARVTYSNFWYRAEVLRVGKWIAVRSARDIATAIAAI